MKNYSPMIAQCLLVTLSATFAVAPHAEGGSLRLRFEQGRFTPQILAVPAGQPLIVKVVNASDQTIEFESFKPNREKAVEPGETVTVQLPTLNPRSYDFQDDLAASLRSRGSSCTMWNWDARRSTSPSGRNYPATRKRKLQ